MEQLTKNQPYQTKEEFYTALDKLELSDKLKAAAITILDIGLDKLNRLPILVIKESNYVKLDYYDNASSIMYVEGFENGRFRYCDLESNIVAENLEECFTNISNLKLANIEMDWESNFEYVNKQNQETSERWRKLHSYLNSILGLECTDDCITDDDHLISAVKDELKSRVKFLVL